MKNVDEMRGKILGYKNDVLGGKTKDSNKKRYVVFVAFEGQCFYVILVQGIRQYCRTVVRQFWSFMASVSGLILEVHGTWSTSTFGISTFCVDPLSLSFEQTFQ